MSVAMCRLARPNAAADVAALLWSAISSQARPGGISFAA